MSSPLSMPATIGPYRVIDHIGSGGMGSVYRVMHGATGRVAAAKVLHAAADAFRSLERFRNEGRILRSLSHPAIATMHEFLELNGSPCIIMEYVDGETLEHLLRTRGPLALPDAMRHFAALVDAVGYIHQRGIIHRDLKTSNVKVDERGQVKLLDFGIARAFDAPRLTATGNVVGTLMALAPEQLRTGEAEPRSDIWALGILLYELLTARLPFEGNPPGLMAERILRASYPPPSAIRPELPRDVDRIVARCLRIRPEERYASAEALLTDVRALMRPEVAPVRAGDFRRSSGEMAIAIAREWRLTASIAGAAVAVAFLAWSLRPAPAPPRDVVNVPATGRGDVAAHVVRPESVLGGRNDRVVVPDPATRVGGGESRGNVSLVRLTVRVIEGAAQVYLDDRAVGTTPYTITAPVGTQLQLRLRRDGCDDMVRSVRLEEGMVETMESLPRCRRP